MEIQFSKEELDKYAKQSKKIIYSTHILKQKNKDFMSSDCRNKVKMLLFELNSSSIKTLKNIRLQRKKILKVLFFLCLLLTLYYFYVILHSQRVLLCRD